MDGSDSYELVQEDPLTMTAGTYSHPSAAAIYDERSKGIRRAEREAAEMADANTLRSGTPEQVLSSHARGPARYRLCA